MTAVARLIHLVRESFEGIYLNISKAYGKCKFADAGLAWKPASAKNTWTLDRDQILSAHWSRASRGYELKVFAKDAVHQLDGFQSEDSERIAKIFKNWYNVPFDRKEHSLKGWNWGKTEFGKQEIAFNVQSRPAFEIPYSEILNTNLAGKNEVAVEFSLPPELNGSANSADDGLGGAMKPGEKTAGCLDQLIEMRFYVPGTAKRDDGAEDVDANSDADAEEQNAAQLFYERLVEKADIGEVAGDTYATFLDVLHLTPRGRFDIDLHETSFRMRGKTYDYKIMFDSVKKIMMLPKPDDIHSLFCLGLDPPLRQGQTRYPFLVMQFKIDEEVTLDLNMTEEELESKYKDRLSSHYEAPLAHVVGQVFRGLTGRKVVGPSKKFSSQHGQHGVKCSIKANEGILFPLDKALMFVPKPATYISIEHIASATLSRVGGALAASRTFDVALSMKPGYGPTEYMFSNINREEQSSLESYFQALGVKVKNQMDDDVRGPTLLLKPANLCSPVPCTARLSKKTQISLAARTKSSEPTGAVLMRMMKVLMRTLRTTRNQMWLKNMIRNMPAAAVMTMPCRWTAMRTVTMRKSSVPKRRARSKRPVS